MPARTLSRYRGRTISQGRGHVDFPTRNHGHTLDYLLSLNEEIIPSNIKSECFISDHCIIISYLNLPHTAIHDSVALAVRNLHKIDMAALNCDLMPLIYIVNILVSLLDYHVPTKSKKVKISNFSEEEVKKLIMSPSKSCPLKPRSICLVNDCVDILIKPITKFLNLSLSEGLFPTGF